MSAKVVVPDWIISSAARRVPIRTMSGDTVLDSPGKMYFCSQSIRARSSAKPRYITIGAWVWVLTSPGRSTCPRASMVSAAVNRAATSSGRPTATIWFPSTATDPGDRTCRPGFIVTTSPPVRISETGRGWPFPAVVTATTAVSRTESSTRNGVTGADERMTFDLTPGVRFPPPRALSAPAAIVYICGRARVPCRTPARPGHAPGAAPSRHRGRVVPPDGDPDQRPPRCGGAPRPADCPRNRPDPDGRGVRAPARGRRGRGARPSRRTGHARRRPRVAAHREGRPHRPPARRAHRRGLAGTTRSCPGTSNTATS